MPDPGIYKKAGAGMDEPRQNEDLNPWHHRAEFPGAKETLLIPTAALFFAACCAFPLSSVGYVRFVLWALLAFGALLLTRRRMAGAWMAIACSAALLPVFGWDASLGVLVMAAAIGLYTGAYLLTVTGKPWLPLLVSIGAAGVAFAIARNPWTAALAFFPIPAVFLLGVAVLREERRTTSVVYAAAGLAVSFAAVILRYFYHRFGTVSVAAVKEAVAIWQMQTSENLAAQYQTLLDSFRLLQQQPGGAQSLSTLESLLSKESAYAYAAELFVLLPAVLLLLCMIPAFFGQKLLVAAYNSNHLAGTVSLGSEIFEVGVPTAILYGLSFIIICFAPSATNLFFAAVENLFYLLLPALCVVGARALPVAYRRFSPGGRVLFWVAGAAILLCNFTTAFSMLALFGTVTTLTAAWVRVLRNRTDDPDDPDGSDDPF